MSPRKRRSRMDKVNSKKKLDQWIVLRFEVVVLVVISIVTVTIAWFVLQNKAFTRGLSLTTADDDYLIVALEAGGTDVLDLPEPDSYVSVQLPDYYNIESGKMAPGASGQMDFYITSKSPIATECYLYADILPVFAEELVCDENDSDEDKKAKLQEQEQINALLYGHIQFYAYVEDEKQPAAEFTYANLIADADGNLTRPDGAVLRRITADKPLRVNLEQDREEMVTIYWRWFYEYTDEVQTVADITYEEEPDENGNPVYTSYEVSAIGDVIPVEWKDENGVVSDTVLIPTNPEYVFDMATTENYMEGKDASSETDREAVAAQFISKYGSGEILREYLINQYDLGDTRIGAQVKQLSFEVYVTTIK